MNDDAELAAFGLTEEGLKAHATAATAENAKRAESAKRFTMAPIPWIYRVIDLLGSAGQAKVVLHALYLMRFGDRSVTLTAAQMRQCGVDARTRNQALRKLERAGLAKVEWPGKAAPIVTLSLGTLPGSADDAVDEALACLAQQARRRWWRPVELLTALQIQPGYTEDCPQTVKQLLTHLRERWPAKTVVKRRGLNWIKLKA